MPASFRRSALILAVFAVGGAVSLKATANEPPLPPPRPSEPVTAAPPAQQPPSQAPSEGAAACLAKLTAAGASAETAPEPASSVEGCGIDAPVRLSSLTVQGDAVSLPDRPLLACEFAAVLADYVRLIVAPLGQAMLHAKVAAIETGPGYECRTQDRIAGAKISAHAKGLAVDFVAIRMVDKRRSPGRAAGERGGSFVPSRSSDGRVRLVHHRPGSRVRRVPRKQYASRRGAA